MLSSSMGVPSKSLKSKRAIAQSALDESRMLELVRITARSMETARPVPFGCSIVHTETGELLMRRLNAVAPEFDPSSHAEVRTIRHATKKLKSVSLKGYTLYTTCEPCPMCMSAALWASLDRVVYGATIKDASRHCNQIHIHADEIVTRSDMRCVVDGPVLREQCYALFTHPNMLRAFSMWSTRKKSKAK
jgi:tRNA(adenine34) deaminase